MDDMHPSTPTPSPEEPDLIPRSPLTPSVISSLQVAAVHRVHTKPVTAMDFTLCGSTMASSSPDGSVSIYDAIQGVHKASIPVQKYGAGPIKFINSQHPSPTLITASTLKDHRLKLLDVGSEGYLRYFRGHDAEVNSLSASPVGPNFISGGKDAWVRVWDVRAEKAMGKVRAAGDPLVAYDPKGLIFSVAYYSPGSKTCVKLYDARQYDEGPFLEFEVDNPADAVPTCFKFSSDGEYFLLVQGDVEASVNVYDAYKGKEYRTFKGHSNVRGVPLEASFSPDSAFVVTGGDDGRLGSFNVWHIESDTLLVQQRVHAMPSTCVAWNPVYQMVASACQNVLFWLPQPTESSPEY